jgi:hypothetical protein
MFAEMQTASVSDDEQDKIISEMKKYSKVPPVYLARMPFAFWKENLTVLKSCLEIEDLIRFDISKPGAMTLTVNGQSVTLKNYVAEKKEGKEKETDVNESVVIESYTDEKTPPKYNFPFSFKYLWSMVKSKQVKQQPIILQFITIEKNVSHLLYETQFGDDIKVSYRIASKYDHALESLDE